jgi:transmembrane 9 superfamily protein 2/4
MGGSTRYNPLCTPGFTGYAQAIQRQYHHNWIIDNLPAASILDTDQYVSTQYVGYPIGERSRIV